MVLEKKMKMDKITEEADKWVDRQMDNRKAHLSFLLM